MRFTRNGIAFKYHGDHLLRYWPWTADKTRKFWSSLYSRDFSSLSEYWKHVGVAAAALIRSPEKLQGFTFLEVLSAWIKLIHPADNVVVLTNIDASAKGLAFWSRLPRDKIENLLRDVVVLRCNDKVELFSLVDAVTPNFADAYGFSAGQFVTCNLKEVA